MRRLSEIVRERVAALLGVGGFLGIGALAAVFAAAPTPDAGALSPLVAAAAEDRRVEILNYGETFGGILNSASLSASEQQALLLAFREFADPSRLKTGTEITLRYMKGDGELRGVDVTVSRDQIVSLARDEFGWSGTLVETPIRVDTLFFAGPIERDLWTAFVGNGNHSPDIDKMPRGDRELVIHYMDRVFSSQVEFARQIQRGDTYRIALERVVREDGTMREGRILAAELVNAGKSLYAIWFDVKGDAVGGYYDLNGESLRRAFLLAPLEYRRISSRFTNGRLHPILNVTRAHNGVDYAAASGTEVMATADGVITVRGVSGSYGNLVEIRHSNGIVTRYAHLSRFAAGTRVGGRVSQGEIIGYVGMTGLATGPHLHYEMHQNGRPRDPTTLEMPQGDPIPAEARERWEAELVVRRALLRGTSDPRGGDTRMAEVPAGAAATNRARNQ